MSIYSFLQPWPQTMFADILIRNEPYGLLDEVLATPFWTYTNYSSFTTTVTVTSGAVPTGMAVTYYAPDAAICLVGTPTVAGTFSFTIQVTNNGNQISASFVIDVAPSPISVIYQDYQGAYVPVLGQQFYMPELRYYGPSPTVTWTATGMPPGLTLQSLTPPISASSPPPFSGIVTGIPTATGQFLFNFTVTGSMGDTQSSHGSLTVVPFQNRGMLLPPVTLMSQYSYQFDDDFGDSLLGAGSGPYTYSYPTPGVGLSMSSSGLLSGVPTAAGVLANTPNQYQFYSVTVTNSIPKSGSKFLYGFASGQGSARLKHFAPFSLPFGLKEGTLFH